MLETKQKQLETQSTNTDMSSIKEKVAKILLDIKAVSLNPKKPFRYTSGMLSPIYTDCRLLISFPKERKEIITFYLGAIKNSKTSIDVVAGTATAGIPWASWVAGALNLPMIYVRSEQKKHGKRNQIEGLIKKGQKALVIEDLISTGKSSIETASAIRESGAKVSHVFSIMTYGLKKSKDLFKENNLELISLTDLHSLVNVSRELSYITANERQSILAWAKDPAS